MGPPAIDVAASIVQDQAGRVLLAERTARQISAGFWELPGGKIDPGETAAGAATRELIEETGLRATRLRPWAQYEHAFPTRRIRLHVFRAEAWDGTPQGREGQRLAWVDPGAPWGGPLLPSNARVFAGLALPPLLAVLGGTGPATTLDMAAAALARGAKLLLLTEPALAPAQRTQLARRLAALAHEAGARLLLEGTALEARQAQADGVLASARALRGTLARPPVALWGARCRGGADIGHAIALGADFVIAAPVLASLDATPPLGWPGLAALAREAPVPVYAQGGLTPALLAEARRAGALGAAVAAREVAQAA